MIDTGTIAGLPKNVNEHIAYVDQILEHFKKNARGAYPDTEKSTYFFKKY